MCVVSGNSAHEFPESVLHSGQIQFFRNAGHFRSSDIAGFPDGVVGGVLSELLEQLLIACFDQRRTAALTSRMASASAVASAVETLRM